MYFCRQTQMKVSVLLDPSITAEKYSMFTIHARSVNFMIFRRINTLARRNVSYFINKPHQELILSSQNLAFNLNIKMYYY